MPVYVDNARNAYGRMKMCHMWADTREELFAMADRIGVARKWFQCPPKASWEHFDIAQSKRKLAVQFGAIETDKYEPVEHIARLRGNQKMLDQVAAARKLTEGQQT